MRFARIVVPSLDVEGCSSDSVGLMEIINFVAATVYHCRCLVPEIHYLSYLELLVRPLLPWAGNFDLREESFLSSDCFPSLDRRLPVPSALSAATVRTDMSLRSPLLEGQSSSISARTH